MQENTDQKNFKYRRFLSNVQYTETSQSYGAKPIWPIWSNHMEQNPCDA